jgi:hypothetical protein
MDEPRIDLSALDPYADRRRFDRTVAAITDSVMEPPAHPVLVDLVRWGRVGLAAAAAVALAAWTPALVSSGAGQVSSASVDSVQLVASWAEAGVIPSDASLHLLAGAADVR